MSTSTVELIKILRDIAAGKKNSVGDYWHTLSYVSEAASRLEDLLDRLEKLA